MIQSISHVCLFLSKLLGAIFGALMLTFILGEFPGQLSALSTMELSLIIFGAAMAVGLILALFKPLIGGSMAALSILAINATAYFQKGTPFEFDLSLQFVLALLLIVFSLVTKRGEAQET